MNIEVAVSDPLFRRICEFLAPLRHNILSDDRRVEDYLVLIPKEIWEFWGKPEMIMGFRVCGRGFRTISVRTNLEYRGYCFPFWTEVGFMNIFGL